MNEATHPGRTGSDPAALPIRPDPPAGELGPRPGFWAEGPRRWLASPEVAERRRAIRRAAAAEPADGSLGGSWPRRLLGRLRREWEIRRRLDELSPRRRIF